VGSFISSVALLFVGEYSFSFLDGMAGAFRCGWVFLFWFYGSGAWVVFVRSMDGRCIASYEEQLVAYEGCCILIDAKQPETAC
jgi:hypothetical protein